MNHLGHLFLSGEDEFLLLGNFIGDVIRVPELKELPEGVQNGVRLHHLIDRYTDRHPEFKKGVARLRPFHGKYAPVVLDILYDHLLALYWGLLSEKSLGEFAEWVYSRFDEHRSLLKGRARKLVDTLVEHRYLEDYKSQTGLKGVLQRMDSRASFPSNFSNADTHLYEQYELFRKEFLEFISAIELYVRNEIEQMKNEG